MKKAIRIIAAITALAFAVCMAACRESKQNSEGSGEMLPAAVGIAANDYHGAYVDKDGKLWALFGDNTDGMFGNVPTVHFSDSHSDGSGDIVCELDNITDPTVIDTDVCDVKIFEHETNEMRYGGKYYSTLLYLKKDGSLWWRGSNFNGMFGEQESSAEPVKLCDGIAQIGSGFYIWAITKKGELLRWYPFDENGENPVVTLKDAVRDDGCFMCLNKKGELFEIRNGETVTIAEKVDFFSGSFENLLTVSNGELAVRRHNIYTNGYEEPEVLMSNVASCGFAGTGNHIFAVDKDGKLYAAPIDSKELGDKPLLENVKTAFGVYNLYALTNDGALYADFDTDAFTDDIGQLRVIANNVTKAYPFLHGTIIFATADGALHAYGTGGAAMYSNATEGIDKAYVYDYILK